MLKFFFSKKNNNGRCDKLQFKWCIQILCVENLILSVSLGANPKGLGSGRLSVGWAPTDSTKAWNRSSLPGPLFQPVLTHEIILKLIAGYCPVILDFSTSTATNTCLPLFFLLPLLPFPLFPSSLFSSFTPPPFCSTICIIATQIGWWKTMKLKILMKY